MFRVMFSPIIRSTWLYLQYLVVFTQVAAGWCLKWVETVSTHRPKHVELTWNNKLIYIVHLVDYFHSCITMNRFINIKLTNLLHCKTCTSIQYATPPTKWTSPRIWRSWIRASWYNNESNQQDALYRLIYYSKSALHVSGDVFAHHQEHMTVFTVSGSVHPSCCQLVSRMSWNSFNSSPETCRADLE
jgi:hypothetical protein